MSSNNRRKSPINYIKKPTLTLCCVVLLLSLFILLLTSFSAFTYYASEEKLQSCNRDLEYSHNYYAAETTATEIINEFYELKRDTYTNLNGRSEYKAKQGTIKVTKIDDNIYFAVPIDKTDILQVEAKVTPSKTEIVKWFVETTK